MIIDFNERGVGKVFKWSETAALINGVVKLGGSQEIFSN